jgi:hypothetical protein
LSVSTCSQLAIESDSAQVGRARERSGMSRVSTGIAWSFRLKFACAIEAHAAREQIDNRD